ncbi:tRNA (adenosine(37)-N6)-threonylcarbamoyltransferase complex ATPase subunit type 1 TsaE, partial [Lactobacillus sp. XV13L]|nr:tRNA (adenosine(37)-N6)-threonylcarbamoyltransferase complex ATPase subunit type 1 TsaE [Lactobacillus sp. XV13L]
IVREYREGRLPVFHMDFYRLGDDDLSSIDLRGYLDEPGLVVIEWPEVIAAELPADYLEIVIRRVDDSWDSTKRVLELNPQGKRNERWLDDMMRLFKK